MSETRQQDQKRRREKHPSGWLTLTRSESVQFVIDALLDSPPGREFTRTELAEQAGVTRQSVSKYLGLLSQAGIVEPVEGTGGRRFRFDPENPVSRAIIELDGAVSGALGGADARDHETLRELYDELDAFEDSESDSEN
jgi:DNA-binding GntR family transcriptional regulator